MKHIISVSRRTDIPAFYGDWFMNRLKEGFVGIVNPFGGQKYIASLKPADVVCFVFWSKNFAPFMQQLKTLDALGFKFYFNYTITALPAIFENNVDTQSAIETLKLLSKIYSPKHINWRFDPIIITNAHDRNFYLNNFANLARQFEGLVERCYFSFVDQYNKVKRNFQKLTDSTGIKIEEPSETFKIDLANDLAVIAHRHGIQMYCCCSDYLISDKIKKAHCIDGSIIEQLFYPEGLHYSQKPTRQQCGCTESIDIGTYDTCPHGCVYCYANTNKHAAQRAFNRHDPNSAFLGYSKSQ